MPRKPNLNQNQNDPEARKPNNSTSEFPFGALKPEDVIFVDEGETGSTTIISEHIERPERGQLSSSVTKPQKEIPISFQDQKGREALSQLPQVFLQVLIDAKNGSAKPDDRNEGGGSR